ncbi:MAG: ABC transporter ATP-binding protein [Chloroflexi bacterium]|nr:ABC transporter ATP-binding protein [Chloroflexota bacterium]
MEKTVEPNWVVDDDFARDADLIRVEGLSKSYGAVAAVRGIDFSIGQGEFLSIVGRSGSGKSTLLYLLAGLEAPDAGHIYCYGKDCSGRDIAQLTEEELAIWRRRQVGLVFQSFHLIPTLSALENVAFPLYPEHMSARERRASALACLEHVGLAHRASHRPTQLSGGEQQRVALARALIGQPSFILADEPTGNLDSQTSHEIINLFQKLHAESGVALVIITHDDRVAAAAERILHMADGRFIQ